MDKHVVLTGKSMPVEYKRADKDTVSALLRKLRVKSSATYTRLGMYMHQCENIYYAVVSNTLCQ